MYRLANINVLMMQNKRQIARGNYFDELVNFTLINSLTYLQTDDFLRIL